MAYWHWLVFVSVVFFVAERVRPLDPAQPLLRRGWLLDLLYLVLNGHLMGLLLASGSTSLSRAFDAWARGSLGVDIHLHAAASWPFWAQLASAFVLGDLMQWCIHNLLHRVPLLWEIHKVHHSIRDMSFAGSMRFHVGESVVYGALQYVPFAIMGWSPEALFALAVIGTTIGHWNHANLRVPMGPLAYVLNGPAMHLWHHAHPDHGPVNVNFGVHLSLWDWLFGTAYLPRGGTRPAQLGFEGIEGYPTSVPGQLVAPLPVSALATWLSRARDAGIGSRPRKGAG